MSTYEEDTQEGFEALRQLADDWKMLRDQNAHFRAAFQEMVDKYTDPKNGFKIQHVRCSYCAEAWPRLDGATLEDVQAQTAAHAEVCPKNMVRIERDRARDEVNKLRTRQQELLSLVANISQSTPLDSEVSEALAQRGALLSEVGTLRARVTELEAQLAQRNAP